MEHQDILKQLLWSARQRRQLAGALIGALIGLILLLGAFQFYLDYRVLFAGEGGQFVQVNKKVSVFNTLGVASKFTEAEIQDLEQQDFVRALGRFVSNEFRVKASSPRLGFSTEMFFEGVPDAFLDVEGADFDWKQGDAELPIIMSRDYLALYNFGFAPSQGLPQFTPNTIRKATFQILVAGPGGSATFTGRIVGFSDRINSILVPLSFMEWANGRFGLQGSGNPVSRLILEVENPMAQDFQDYLTSHQLELSSGRLIGGQFATLAKLISGLFVALGLLILLLSALVFSLNFRLLIAQAQQDLRLLLHLGYKQDQLLALFFRYQLFMLGGILVASLLILNLLHLAFATWMDAQGLKIPGALHGLVWALALGITLLALLLNRSILRKNLAQLAA